MMVAKKNASICLVRILRLVDIQSLQLLRDEYMLYMKHFALLHHPHVVTTAAKSYTIVKESIVTQNTLIPSVDNTPAIAYRHALFMRGVSNPSIFFLSKGG